MRQIVTNLLFFNKRGYAFLRQFTGKDSCPITGASFILIHKSQAEALIGRTVLKFFDWSYKKGAKMAAELDYVPMPAPVVKLVNEAWKAQLKDASGKAIW